MGGVGNGYSESSRHWNQTVQQLWTSNSVLDKQQAPAASGRQAVCALIMVWVGTLEDGRYYYGRILTWADVTVGITVGH